MTTNDHIPGVGKMVQTTNQCSERSRELVEYLRLLAKPSYEHDATETALALLEHVAAMEGLIAELKKERRDNDIQAEKNLRGYSATLSRAETAEAENAELKRIRAIFIYQGMDTMATLEEVQAELAKCNQQSEADFALGPQLDSARKQLADAEARIKELEYQLEESKLGACHVDDLLKTAGGERDNVLASVVGLSENLQEAQALIKAVAAALEPFARAAAVIDSAPIDKASGADGCRAYLPGVWPTMDDLRACAAALKLQEAGA